MAAATRRFASQALAGGATVIQLRDKGASTKELCELGQRLQALAASAGGLFIVNDRVDVALAVDADGVHLGQDDMPAHVARKLLGPDKVMGVSVENAKQAERAAQDGADYIGIGAIYEARGTKSDAGDPIGPQAVCRSSSPHGLAHRRHRRHQAPERPPR